MRRSGIRSHPRAELGQLAKPARRLVRSRSGILADERGSAAVEFAFIGPILILLLIGIVQFSAAFFLRSEMLNVAREAARRLAVGALTAAAAPAWVEGQLPGREDDLSVDVDPPGGGSELYRVTLSLPLASITGIDPFGLFGEGDLSVSVSMRDERGAT